VGYKDPNKRRFLTVIEGGIPDRVPNYEVLIMSKVASALLGREVPDTLTGAMSAQDYIELVHLVGQDFIGLSFFGYPYMRVDDGGMPLPPEILTRGGATTREQVAALMGPDQVLEVQIKGLLGPKLEAYARAVEGTDVGLFVLTGMLLQSIYQFVVGFEDFMVMLYTDRGFIEELLDASAEFHRRIVEFVCQYPIDMLYMADDVAFKSGLMIRPEVFLDLWEERMRYAIQPARDQGIPMIFHSDGTVYDIIDTVIDMGFRALNPIEPYGMDIYTVKARWGDRIALMGNMDIAGPLAFGTPEDVVADTKEHLERLMPGGRYIVASSHSIMDNVPTENYLAMIDTVHEYGRYA
jgi:uroporphyrinogen decarboxylase